MFDGIVNFIGGGISGLGSMADGVIIGIVAGLVSTRIPSIISGAAAGARAWIKGEISLIKDPDAQKICLQSIALVQKTMASEAGRKRLEAAIQYVQKKIPGKYDDAVVRATIQSLYDEAMKPL